MSITKRRYCMLADFQKAHDFLTETYDKETLNSYLLPQYFEYAHCHSYFDAKRTHRMGVWEDDGYMVGIAAYEMNLGKCHLHTKNGYESLLPELLLWSEQEMSVVKGDKKSIKIWITSKETNKRDLLKANGYSLCYTEPVNTFDYSKGFINRILPEGFSIIDGKNVDYNKLHTCFWRGFDHGDTPDDDVEGSIADCVAPHSNLSLMTIAVAPDGEYACALGMWFDETNKYAYLEPLATPPKYRRMGLASICLTEAMKKTEDLGAKYCFGGGGEFYSRIGFTSVCNRELWEKEW